MDWFFLGLVILGSVWGWTKESKEVFGQHAIQEVTKERFGRLVIVCGWVDYFGVPLKYLKNQELFRLSFFRFLFMISFISDLCVRSLVVKIQ